MSVCVGGECVWWCGVCTHECGCVVWGVSACGGVGCARMSVGVCVVLCGVCTCVCGRTLAGVGTGRPGLKAKERGGVGGEGQAGSGPRGLSWRGKGACICLGGRPAGSPSNTPPQLQGCPGPHGLAVTKRGSEPTLGWGGTGTGSTCGWVGLRPEAGLLGTVPEGLRKKHCRPLQSWGAGVHARWRPQRGHQGHA